MTGFLILDRIFNVDDPQNWLIYARSVAQRLLKWLALCCAPRSLLSGARTCSTNEYNRDEKQGFVHRPIVPAFSRTTAWATETKDKQHRGQRSPCAAARYPRQAIHEEIWRSCNFSCCSMMITEHYRRLAADYFCLGYEHSEQARAPHTNGPRDVPRCGALS